MTTSRFDTEELIRRNEFAEVRTFNYKKEGLERGSFVYVTDMIAVPFDKNDPYKQELLAVCHPCDEEGYLKLSEDTKLVVAKPKKLRRVSVEKSQELHAKFEELQDRSKRNLNEASD